MNPSAASLCSRLPEHLMKKYKLVTTTLLKHLRKSFITQTVLLMFIIYTMKLKAIFVLLINSSNTKKEKI